LPVTRFLYGSICSSGRGFAVGFVVGCFDGLVGSVMLAGLMGGPLVANVWGIRTARANRDLIDEAEATLARAHATAGRDAMGVPAVDAEVRQDAPVGQVLRDTVALERRRSVAWLVAGAIALAACGVLDAPIQVTIVEISTGGLALIWVVRRLWAAWLALQDFTKAATSPRRAFVVLLHDPAPRMIRPLLGAWSDAPVLRDGRLPKPERVYRCDEELDALECHQGSVVVHEAWVDTGPRRWAKPRWVAADAGIAVPHRRALFGRSYMSSLISGERPEKPRRLTLQQPRADNEVIVELGRNVGTDLRRRVGGAPRSASRVWPLGLLARLTTEPPPEGAPQTSCHAAFRSLRSRGASHCRATPPAVPTAPGTLPHRHGLRSCP
jgi:hypothetical protein